MLLRALFTILLTTLVACGGGGSGSPSTDASGTPASVEITTQAVLLTETGQTKALSARVLDSTGREITATVSWESTQPGQISVNSAGQVTALGDGGSGQITARVGELRSAPLLVFHSQVPAGTLLLTDAQIVGEPEETSPGAAPSASNTYRVRLSGVAAPAVGQLVLNTEAEIVVGRVQTVSTDASGVHTVTLGLVPLREVLPTLRINETIDLSQAPVTIPADVLANYNVAREGTRYTFTPKVTVAAARAAAAMYRSGAKSRDSVAAASGTSALPPFKECEFTVEGAGGADSLPIQLDKVPGFTVEFKPALDMVHTPEGGLERLVLSTEPSVTTDLSLEFTAGFDGKLTCDIDLLVVRIPTPGPVAAFLSGLVTMGAGMELSGKVELPGAKLGSLTQRATTLDVGLACPAGGSCSLVHEVGATTVTSKATVEGPDLNDIRLEPSLFGYGKATASIGNPFFTSLRFDAFYAKLGVAFQTSLASIEAQISDPDHKSHYGLSALFKAGLATEFEGLAAWLGLNGVAENLVEGDVPLAESPTGTLTLAHDNFSAGERVEATVKFTDGTTFLGVYNVDEVILMRKVGSGAAQEVARGTLGEGRTQMSLSFVPASDGTAGELTVFVITRGLPGASLEIAHGVAERERYSRVADSAGGQFAITECVLDTQTGLTWEGKTASGLRSYQQGYTHFDSTESNQNFNGNEYVPPTQEQILAPSNSIGYVNYVNSTGLCGYTDWRLPTDAELLALIDNTVPYPGPSINATWFPNTTQGIYWSSSPFTSGNVFYDHGGNGVSFALPAGVSGTYRFYFSSVRLVRP